MVGSLPVLTGSVSYVLQGDYDPGKTKVLHLEQNPVELARKRRALLVETLTQENNKLKERVRILEEAEGKVRHDPGGG